eukprot:COSAG01_NODE_6966_length_3413_cov_7.056427_3_plen_199_part_00
MSCSLSDVGWLTFLLRRWFPAGLKWPLVKLVVPVALFDFGDKWFQLFGIKGAGSGLYIVIFSSLTVWTALIRRVGFGRKLESSKWAAVAMITIGLAVDSINVVVEHPVKCDKDGEPVQDRVDMTLIFGMLAALACAMFDAAMCAWLLPCLHLRCMYVCVLTMLESAARSQVLLRRAGHCGRQRSPTNGVRLHVADWGH